MAKRSATNALECDKIKRRVILNAPDFTVLAQRRQICEAVAAAIRLGTDQPVILNVMNEETGEVSPYAYYPASREVGEWLLQYLEHTAEAQKCQKHYAITALIENETLRPDVPPMDAEAIFKGLFGDLIKTTTDLGQFLVLLSAGEDACGDARMVVVTSLNTFLYQQTCYTNRDPASNSSSESSGSSSSESESESDSSSDSDF